MSDERERVDPARLFSAEARRARLETKLREHFVRFLTEMGATPEQIAEAVERVLQEEEK